MANYAITNPYPVILNQIGGGLNGGKVYIGEANKDPETFPIPVYWDEAGTDPAAQPLRTIGGYIVRAGTPAAVFASPPYSIRVRDRFNQQVFYSPNGAGALSDFITDLASSDGSNLIGFSQSTSYTPGRAGHRLAQEIFITDLPFAGKGDGSTNNDLPFATGIALLQARGGGVLRVPAGDWRYTSITIPAGPAVLIQGDGFTTALRTTQAIGTGIAVFANDSGVHRCRLTSAPIRTNFDPLVMLSGGNCYVSECSFDGDKCGIKMDGSGCDVYQNTFANGAAGARRIWATGGDLSQAIHDNLMHYQAPGVESGVYTDNSAALKIYNNDIIGQGECLKIAPGNGQVVVNLRSYDNFYDTAASGISVTPTGSGKVTRCRSINDWGSSHTANGFLFDTTASTSNGIDGFDVVDSEAHLNANNGISLVGTLTRNLRIRDPQARSNDLSGVSIGTGVSNFSIIGLDCRATDDLNVNDYGVFLSGSNDNYEIRGCRIQGQSSSAISGHPGWSATKRVYSNMGYTTSSSGASAVPTGQTSVVVNHGLSEAPRQQDIQLTPTVSGTTANPIWLDTTTITATQMTIRVASAAGGNLSFAWKIEVGDH